LLSTFVLLSIISYKGKLNRGMKSFPSFLLGLALAVFQVDASTERDLQASPFDVAITHVGASDQTIHFNTGTGMNGSAKVKVKVYDKCRGESPTRIDEGFLYPDNSVPGIIADNSGIVDPGPGSVLKFNFAAGIAENTDIYTPGNLVGTATVSFCVEVGLYGGDMLANFKEVKLTYQLNLLTNVGQLTSHVPYP
jgi:hypothetical protein